ncbi:MAG: PorT family protein [Hymenobacteraceae bacterium]|nr:PorT family protein [Hymenobacteraceae bacterium]
MKKVLFLLAVSAATIGSAAAQGLTYGIKAGANYANLWGKNKPSGSTYAFGGLGGLAVNYAFNDLASLQVEGLFSQKGFKVTDFNYENAAGEKFKAEGSQVLNYVDIPVLVKINTSMLFFELGPQVGLLINSKLKDDYEVKGADGKVISERSSSSDANAIIGHNKVSRTTGGIPTFDIGIIAGVGYNITPAFSFGVRYNAGLKTLVDTKNTSAGDEQRLYNNAFQAQLGYMFGAISAGK